MNWGQGNLMGNRACIINCKSLIVWRARKDSNLRPPGSKPGACATVSRCNSTESLSSAPQLIPKLTHVGSMLEGVGISCIGEQYRWAP